jgi:hypothetical protein
MKEFFDFCGLKHYFAGKSNFDDGFSDEKMQEVFT